jgi:hypothetical protein
MLCPDCKGQRERFAFVDGYDEHTGQHWGGIRMMPCFTCNGTGEVDDCYPEWRERGRALKARRMEPYVRMGDMADRLGIGLCEYSRMERGISDPTPAERAMGEL